MSVPGRISYACMMRMRTLALAGVFGSAGFFAGRGRTRQPAGPAAAAHRPGRTAAGPHRLPGGGAGRAIETDDPADDGGEDVAELLAAAGAPRRGARPDPECDRRPRHDAQTGEPLSGVTHHRSSTPPALAAAWSAISDDHGDYAITGLEPATYNMTFYYTDVTIDRGLVALGGLEPTRVVQAIDLPWRISIVATSDPDVDVQGFTFEVVTAE